MQQRVRAYKFVTLSCNARASHAATFRITSFSSEAEPHIHGPSRTYDCLSSTNVRSEGRTDMPEDPLFSSGWSISNAILRDEDENRILYLS